MWKEQLQRIPQSLKTFKREIKAPFLPIDTRGRKTEILDPSHAPYFIEGQGTYTQGLAGDLVNRYPVYWKVAEEVTGRLVRRDALHATREELAQTDRAQIVIPAYMLSCIAELQETSPGAMAPEIAGKSLGFVIGAEVAGCFESLKQFFEFLDRRGTYMKRDCDRVRTGLMNVSDPNHLGWDSVEYLLKKYDSEIAFIVSETRLRIGGELAKLEEFSRELKEEGFRAKIMEDVGGAFHTNYFAWSREKLSSVIDSLNLRNPDRPLVSNTAPVRFLKTGKEVTQEMKAIITEAVDEKAMMELLVKKEGYKYFYRIGQPKPFVTEGKELVPVKARVALGGAVLAAGAVVAWKEYRKRND